MEQYWRAVLDADAEDLRQHVQDLQLEGLVI